MRPVGATAKATAVMWAWRVEAPWRSSNGWCRVSVASRSCGVRQPSQPGASATAGLGSRTDRGCRSVDEQRPGVVRNGSCWALSRVIVSRIRAASDDGPARSKRRTVGKPATAAKRKAAGGYYPGSGLTPVTDFGSGAIVHSMRRPSPSLGVTRCTESTCQLNWSCDFGPSPTVPGRLPQSAPGQAVLPQARYRDSQADCP